jgi:hypothetical protein
LASDAALSAMLGVAACINTRPRTKARLARTDAHAIAASLRF